MDKKLVRTFIQPAPALNPALKCFKKIVPLGKSSSKSETDTYKLKRTHYRNCLDENVRKIVSKLYGKCTFELTGSGYIHILVYAEIEAIFVKKLGTGIYAPVRIFASKCGQVVNCYKLLYSMRRQESSRHFFKVCQKVY